MRSAPRRRVAFVVNSLNSGGAERAALNLAAACDQFECMIVAERRAGDLLSDPAASSAVFVSQSPAVAARPTRIVALARKLHSVSTDVVVSMMSPLVTASAARLIGAPVIHWLQAPWSQTTAITTPTVRGKVERAVLRTVLRRSSMVVGTTPGLCGECASLGVPISKLAVLPNGLHLDSQREAERGNGGRPATVVTVGRLERPKRHDLTIRAVARISADTPLRLVLVGSGAEEAGLRALAADIGVADHVEFTGFVQSPQEHLRRADVFVLGTDYEGFGNVIVEALAAGLPVVVPDVPYGPRFILSNGRYGNLVAPQSSEALEEGIRAALSRGPLNEQARAELHARAESFSIDKTARRFEELAALATRNSRSIPPRLREWP